MLPTSRFGLPSTREESQQLSAADFPEETSGQIAQAEICFRGNQKTITFARTVNRLV